MSMNYVGSISLMDKGDYDRGDSPAQAVLDKNARSVAQRIADETREELEKVLERVEHIYDSYENSMELIFQTQHSANMEYVNDINELEEIMKDQIKKRKYQQGLTIFIVGYENVCGQRLKLLQNVNEFFMENSKSVEEEDWFPKTPDLDLDDAAENIDQSLNKAEDLANRLGEINQEMVNWLSNYAINKASSKALAFVDAKGKKKLEKALEKAKEDLGSLSEKLHNLQLDLEDKESKYQDLLKMLENKNLETQKYKTAAEIAKKNVTELEIENAVMKEDLEKRKNFMKDLQRKLNRAENELSQNDMLKDIQANQISDQYQETQSMEALTAKKKIQELQETVDKNKSKTEEVKREIEKFHETQIVAITQAHAAEVDAMKNEYEEELKKAKAESGEIQKKIDEAEQAAKTAEEEADSLRHNLIELQLRAASAETRNSELADLDEDPSRLNSQQDSRPSTKNSRQSSKGKPLPTKSPKRDGKSGKDLADTSMQDEGGDPNTAHVETRQSKKNKSSLEPLREGEVTEFTDQYDLKDNDAWATLPLEQMQSRYIQYRKLTKERLEELEDQLEVTVAKTQRKVNNLKHQFQEHKNKWESERKLLIDQVEQAQKLQTEAEKEADTAMGQLEEFINEQERLEDEEEGKRTDIVKAVTRPSRKKSPDEAGDRKSVSSDTQTQKEPEAAEPQSSTERPSEEHTEPELSRLLQQTDDAKVQEMNSRITGAMSAPPAVEDGVEVTDKKGLLRTRSGGSRSRSPRPGSSDKVENAQSLHPLSSAYAIEEISEGHSSNSGSPLSDGSRSNNSKSNPRSNTRSPHINTRSSPSQQDGGHSRSAWNTPRGETHLASRERSAKSDASSRKGTSPKYYQMSPDNFETPPRSADSIRKVALSRSEWLEEEEDEEEETPQQPYTSPVKSLPQQKPYTSPEVSVKTLPQNQAEALDNVNQMITHEKLSSYQTRALDSVRMALQQINEDQENLSNQQLERTLTMISLASQLTEESLHLGLLPDSIFDTFAVLNSRAMSDMSHGEDEYSLDDNMSAYNTGAEFLRPITKMSVENQNMTAFLQELSHHSLKSLPPLGGVLTSSQSQRPYIGEATFSSIDKYKPPSAPQRMVSYLDDRDTTFDTEATMGTMSRVNTLTSFLPKIKPDSRKHTKILRSRGVDVQTFDYHDMETQTSPPPEQQPQSVQTKPESPESVRESSALSRASLRSQYKAKLEETRQAVEERRSNTPAISIPSPRSLEEDQLIEDEDDDVALPDDFKDGRSREATMDVATSPPLDKRDSITRYSTKPDDPVIQEYLKTYDSIISFRDALSKILLDKEMLQASQVLTELETARFDRDDKLEPQVEMMTSNAYYLFEEIIAVLGSILYTEEREPVVSSMMISREGTKPMTREKSGDSLRGALRQSRVSSVASQGLDKGLLNELQDNYTKLQKQFEGESKKHEEQIRHNTVVMMEMQDTINELQRELGNLGRSASRIRQSSDLATPQGVAESAIMFTRLDSERNAKIMKRAVNDEKLDPDQYKDAVSKMEDYVSIPAKRLAHLVRKYVHHCRMKEIEENVKKSKSLDENVFEVLDKMENFQNKRAKQWADGMDHMGNDRLRFANILMETLENIEQQSGIFLIKPMYSFKGRDTINIPDYLRDIKERYAGKLARPMRPQRNISPAREISSFAPAPTPASNIRGLTRGHVSSSLMQAPEEEVRPEPLRPLVGDDSGITGAGMVWVGSVPRSTWNIGSSQVRAIDDLQNPNMMNTPRILELDINRMMIGQNNISTRITSPGVSDDRLVNASQNNLRSYVTVNRPAPAPGQARPSTFSSVKDNVPPSSPTAHQYTPSPSVQKRVRMSDGDVGRAINSTPPLPPISGGSRGRHSPEETNISTASLQPQVLEVVSPLK
ncbi:golgin subfamily A member 4-like isoform X7 [Mytilus trossulus]|uniref:golgin subfamily A member 4-like isoform X7 n=1 Tax=Mytilus trossulus TaxID=6551 RepID=UPI003007ABF7